MRVIRSETAGLRWLIGEVGLKCRKVVASHRAKRPYGRVGSSKAVAGTGSTPPACHSQTLIQNRADSRRGVAIPQSAFRSRHALP